MPQWQILLSEKAKLFNFIIYSKEKVFSKMLWVELRGIMVTVRLSKHSPMTLAGKMVIAWENKAEWWAFEVMLTVSKLGGIHLAKGKDGLGGHSSFYAPWSTEGTSGQTWTSRTLWNFLFNIVEYWWQLLKMGQCLETEIVSCQGSFSAKEVKTWAFKDKELVLVQTHPQKMAHG